MLQGTSSLATDCKAWIGASNANVMEMHDHQRLRIEQMQQQVEE